jgi:RecB family endonuclease NucS
VRARLDLESRLESWLGRDICVLDRALLVIGRQVETDFGGIIDLLCLDHAGDIVVVELKRDKTPREITAQAFLSGNFETPRRGFPDVSRALSRAAR